MMRGSGGGEQPHKAGAIGSKAPSTQILTGFLWLWYCPIGVITSDPTMPHVCPRGAIQTGAAAEVAALSKERAWTAQAKAQGGNFYPLAIEAGDVGLKSKRQIHQPETLKADSIGWSH